MIPEPRETLDPRGAGVAPAARGAPKQATWAIREPHADHPSTPKATHPAPALLKRDTSTKIGVQAKRHEAGRDPDHLQEVRNA